MGSSDWNWRPVDIRRKVTSLKMLIGVVRGWPRDLGDETTAPTRGASVLASGECPQSDLATFNKYERRWHSRGGSSIAGFLQADDISICDITCETSEQWIVSRQERQHAIDVSKIHYVPNWGQNEKLWLRIQRPMIRNKSEALLERWQAILNLRLS